MPPPGPNPHASTSGATVASNAPPDRSLTSRAIARTSMNSALTEKGSVLA
jgi:hypothetical protein